MAPGKGGAGRPSKQSQKLSKETVLKAAMSLVAAEGVDAVSFRRLSQGLNVTAMAVAYHAGTKHQLLSDLVALAFSGLPDKRDAVSVQEGLRGILSDYCRRALQHSGLVRAMLADPSLMSPEITAITEEIRRFTRELNEGEDNDVLLNLLVDYTHGFVFAASAAPADQVPTEESYLRSLDWILARSLQKSSRIPDGSR